MSRKAKNCSREDIQTAKRLMKRCSSSLIIRKMQIKNRIRDYLRLVRMAIIKKARSNKYWKGYGEKGTLVPCWWGCKLVQPLWKTVWRFLRNLGIVLVYDLAIPLLGIYLKHMKSNLNRCIQPCVHCGIIYNSQDMEIAHWWMNGWKRVYNTVEYYPSIKKIRIILPFVVAWMDLENIALNKSFR